MKKLLFLPLISLFFLPTPISAQTAVKNVDNNDANIIITGLTPSVSHKFIYNNKPATKQISTNACGYGIASDSIGTITFNNETFAAAPFITDRIKCVNGVIEYPTDTPANEKISNYPSNQLFKTAGTTGPRILIGNVPPFSNQVVTSTTEKDDRTSTANSCGIVTLKRNADWNNNTTIVVQEKVGGDYQPVGTINFSSLPVSDAICSKGTSYFKQGFPSSSNL